MTQSAWGCGRGRGTTPAKMADTTAVVDKALLGFLNGICKRQFFGEEDISDEFLREDVLGGMAEEEYAALLKRYASILNSLASTDMDFNQLSAFLQSQMKKRQGALTESEAATVTRFWKSQKTKVHEQLVKKSVWGDRLKQVSWRVDVKTKSRHIDQINTPTGIIELQLGKEDSEKPEEVVRFEVDERKLGELLSQIQDIEQALQTHSQS
ncbi:COMM domain-containing protein 1 [Geodia barretti]|uniref:COMM domain-containing protein 1 n=1 Tax=Geodia barretti TaxID=519541 RepID=A0AA35WGF8_GEOBA|nr:COMM domain-containing protein 1 [Geodia barretti]